MIGIYIRLSESDIDLETNELKDESNSITHQRELILDFIGEHPDLAHEEVEEFVDDGYSGTNFERPAFQRMMELVRQRTVDVVIVKDFSRFGRDYIEVGDYIERIFPFMGVRFLAVNDRYDSNTHQIGDDQDLEIIMKNILNSYYSKDLSQKISSTIRNKRAKGQYVARSRPFGYLIDEENPSNIKIDPVAGQYVRRIFDLALEGRTTGQIAAKLNEEGVPCCSVYNGENDIPGKAGMSEKFPTMYWRSAAVHRLLTDPVYKGTYTSAKKRRFIVGVNRLRAVPKEEIVIMENHHEGIVTEEEFEKAQEVVRAHYPSQAQILRHPLKGKVVCGCCRHHMTYNERKVIDCFFRCLYKEETNMELGCYKERINEGFLNQLVFRELKKWFLLLQQVQDKVEAKNQELFQQIQSIGKKVNYRQTSLNKLQRQKVELYEQYSEGALERELFIQQKNELVTKIDRLRSELEQLHEEEKALRKKKRKDSPEFQQLMKNVDIFADETILTRTMTETFLDHVVVYDDKHIEVRWLWADMIERFGGEEYDV